MTLVKMILLFALRIHKAGYKTTCIRNRELQGRSCRALVVASGVVAVPREDARYSCVHAGCHEESHAVLDLGVGGLADDAVADYGNR